MTILIAALISFALGIAAFFLLLMADGRRLRERMLDRRPRFVPEETEPEAQLVRPDYPLWMTPPFTGPKSPRTATPRSLYSTTPESPGLG